MWQIQSREYGEDAFPSRGIGLESAQRSRFAKIVAYNESKNIVLPLYIYLPVSSDTCTEIIFSIHGYDRNANKYRNIFVPHVQEKNVMIVAPSFTDDFYENSLSLKLGNMCRGTKGPVFLPESDWTFTHIVEIFELLKKEIPTLKSFSLFGHSAGAQFVHRMVLFGNSKNMKTAVAANAGWYTTVDDKTNFPYGTGGVCNYQKSKSALASKLVLAAGESDIEQDDKLRITKQTLKQGQNRLERARYAFASAQRSADLLSVNLSWNLVIAPGVAHSSRSILPFVLEYLL